MVLTLGQRIRLTLTAPPHHVKSTATLLLLCLFALAGRAQFSEHDQTGRITASDGSQLPYTIRMLPLASFPDLPAPIRRSLSARGCLIPQTYEAHQPENVIHGAFERPGSEDWAVLCAVHGTTSLLAFFSSGPAQPFTLAASSTTDWIAIEDDRVRGFAWGIDSATPSGMPRGLAATHDAISDAFIEHTAKLHYYTEGHWITVDRSD